MKKVIEGTVTKNWIEGMGYSTEIGEVEIDKIDGVSKNHQHILSSDILIPYKGKRVRIIIEEID